jgi:hypothetical protein
MADETELRRRVVELEQRVAELEALRLADGRAADGDVAAPGPYFVGGTGRSGTWLVGRLLGRHPDITVVRTELRFHASEGGFGRVLTGDETPAEYAARVRERWFGLAGPGGRAKGLFLIATSGQLSAATRQLVELAEHDVALGLGAFVHTLVDPFAFGRGSRTWVETTPDNAAAAHELTTVFPRGRVIDIVRDGRDSAASVITMPWGPSTPDEALDWWAERVRLAHESLSRSPAHRVLRLRFEEFSLTHRDERLDQLLDFASINRSRAIESYFAKHVDPERAHIGRWRGELTGRERDRFDHRYTEIYEELRGAGVTNLPIEPAEADRLAI